MKGLLLAIIVVGIVPLVMACRQLASIVRRQFAVLFYILRSSRAVAAPSFTIAITCPDAQRDAVARKVVVRHGTQHRALPGSVRPSIVAAWRETPAEKPAVQETASRSM